MDNLYLLLPVAPSAAQSIADLASAGGPRLLRYATLRAADELFGEEWGGRESAARVLGALAARGRFAPGCCDAWGRLAAQKNAAKLAASSSSAAAEVGRPNTACDLLDKHRLWPNDATHAYGHGEHFGP